MAQRKTKYDARSDEVLHSENLAVRQSATTGACLQSSRANSRCTGKGAPQTLRSTRTQPWPTSGRNGVVQCVFQARRSVDAVESAGGLTARSISVAWRRHLSVANYSLRAWVGLAGRGPPRGADVAQPRSMRIEPSPVRMSRGEPPAPILP